ncbi:pVSP [Giardia muris]|uniref:PVSP n=1 Tax=Giardia muris TaxID=5742 RepID=A0A4Z1SLL6_GIAMU|nr:pVSP [Giardia muris]|eukprot:TNJ26544.1 pVSP [Giardia muris]
MEVKNARALSCTEGAGTGECIRARTTCTDPNCKTCDPSAPDQCTDCNAGYFVESNACTACPANCATCSDADTCDTCKTGYDTPASKCNTCASGYKPDSSGSITQCFDCTSCDHCTEASQANTCKTCATGYAVGTGKCDACASGYLPDANNANCYSCSVPNCVQASADGTCSGCADEYFLDTTCKKCSAGCKTCTDATVTTCSACMPGYHPNSTTAPVSCTACAIKNCGACDDDVSVCKHCASGFGSVYSPYPTIKECKKCPEDCDRCFEAGVGFICVECSNGKVPINGVCADVNDKVCTGSSGHCTSCKNGFMPYYGACLSPQSADTIGICALKNQLLVGETLVCKECKAGSVPIDGTCTPLTVVNRGTTRTTGANDICLNEAGTDPVSSSATRCGSCKNPTGSNSYFLFEGGCYPASSTPGTSVGSLLCSAASNGKCTTPAPNAPFILDTTSGAFTACPKECGACTSSTACSSCALGYYSNSTVTGPSDCTACPSGCTSCPSGKCDLCWDGSTPTNNACPPPPSSSSSRLSGGAIAGIVIAVLLVLGGLGGFLGWWFGCRGK